MNRSDSTGEALDDLAAAALAGDGGAESALFRSLRVRFLAVAKRRVREDDAEDVVQEALRIVHGKHGGRSPHAGILVWSFMVLRNVIGNYYQKTKRERKRRVLGPPAGEGIAPAAASTGALGARAADEAFEHFARAIALLGKTHPRCARLFRAVLECHAAIDRDEVPRAIMGRVRRRFPEMNRNAFYVALHRCRSRLRKVLAVMEGGDVAGGAT